MLLNHWNGKILKLEQPFFSLIDSIILHAQNQSILCIAFFHSQTEEAFVLNITNLDEALTVLLHNIQRQRPS
jgi:hypothetical protein